MEVGVGATRQTWKAGETVLLIQAPGWKIGRTVRLITNAMYVCIVLTRVDIPQSDRSHDR